MAVTTVYGQANYVIEIGDGTSTTHSMPCDGYWSYAWSTYILTTEQIGTPMLINEIQFDVDNNPSNYTMNNQQLYLKQTTANTVSGAYPEPTNNDFTLVFDGSVTWDGRGWQGVFLDSEFAYDGNSNLQLVWLNNRGACPSGYPLFKKTDTGVNSGAYQQSNNNFPAISGSRVFYFPNTRISGLIPGLISFLPAHYATDISLTPTLSLEVDDRYTHFALYFGTNPSSLTNLIPYSPITDLISYTFTEPLDDCTDYYWRVNLADNNSGYTSFIFSFRTLISMSGSGTIQDPYLIDNIADLKTLSSGSSLWDKHFLQTSDIDASSAYVSPIGKYPDYFSGSYDGQNHTISNLRLSSSLPGFGLFGRTENANISNLGLIDVFVVGAGNVGGLIGRGVDITINNCYVTGTVCAVGFSPGPNGELTPGGNCGGLAGHLEYSFIDNSYARVSVNSISEGGGLVGYLYSGGIRNSYATGDVSSSNNPSLGGLVEFAPYESIITNCYATGAVNEGDYEYDQGGGLIGYQCGATITNSFWDIETTGQATSAGGIGKTTLEMQEINTYLNAGRDFVDEVTNGTEDIWAIHPELNLGYPYIVGPEFNSPEIVNFVPSETEIIIKLGNPLVFSIIAETMHGDIVYKWYVNKTEQDGNTHIFNYQFTEPLEYQVKAVVSNGSYSAEQAWNVNVVVSNEDNAAVPLTTGLVSNYPNPFNPDTTIQYSLKEAGKISVTIYDLRGRVVKKLHNAYENAGVHSVTWNGLNSDDQDVASGVYLIRMKSEDGNHTRKITLLK